MNKQQLISNINSEEVWQWAKYLYASKLMQKFYGEDVITFLQDTYRRTNDTTYLEILQGKVVTL
jgi:hypothetical protein